MKHGSLVCAFALGDDAMSPGDVHPSANLVHSALLEQVILRDGRGGSLAWVHSCGSPHRELRCDVIRSGGMPRAAKVWEGQRPNQFCGLDFEAAVDLLLALNVAKTLQDLSPLKSVVYTSSRASGKASGL